LVTPEPEVMKMVVLLVMVFVNNKLVDVRFQLLFLQTKLKSVAVTVSHGVTAVLQLVLAQQALPSLVTIV
jgi:hypothetical protein